MPVNVQAASLTLTLPANALPSYLTVMVQADSAGQQALGNVGQVRVQGNSVVIDFGIPLTVSNVTLPGGSGLSLKSIFRWRGDSFDTTPANAVWSTTATSVTTASFPEVASNRLQIVLDATNAPTQAQAEAITVQLPSLPADLELRVNGGPAIWRYPGPRPAPGTDGWVTVGPVTQKEVDLTDAIEPFLGNPDGNGKTAQVVVELRARTPGRLGVIQGTLSHDLVQRVKVLPDPNLVFDAEGDHFVSLSVSPSPGTNLKEVWVTLAAAPPKERAVPAVGPDRVNQVELVLDSGRSATVRFPENQLAELTALRLPLRAQDGTAEVRAQLLAPVGTPPNDEPGQPLDGPSATQPVEIEPPPAPRGFQGAPQLSQDSWVLLPFDKPVAVKTAFWVSLQVTRGTVRWSLGSQAVNEGDPPAYPVRRGAPTGPWLPLPEAVLSITGLCGRLHAIGHPPKEAPLAPVQLQVANAGFSSPLTDVTPTAKGVTVKLPVAGAIPAQTSWLRVVSRTATTLTVQSLIRVIAKP